MYVYLVFYRHFRVGGTVNLRMAGSGVTFVNKLFVTCIVFLLLNVNSLVNKVNLLHNLCVVNGVWVVGVCETWLTYRDQSSVVNIPGFNFFRNDSPSGVGKHGVGIYLRTSLKVGQVFKAHSNTLYFCPTSIFM